MATLATVTVENTTKETEQQNNGGNCNVCMSIPWAVRYDDIYQMDEIKNYRIILCSMVYIVVSQNTLLPVIPFHHLSDCDLYTPPTTRREGETEEGGDENDQPGHNQ